MMGCSATEDRDGLVAGVGWLVDNLTSKVHHADTFTCVVTEQDIHAGFETGMFGSRKAGKLKKGDKIRVMEVRKNSKNINRIRFKGPTLEDTMRPGETTPQEKEGWVSERLYQKGVREGPVLLEADAQPAEGVPEFGMEPVPEFGMEPEPEPEAQPEMIGVGSAANLRTTLIGADSESLVRSSNVRNKI